MDYEKKCNEILLGLKSLIKGDPDHVIYEHEILIKSQNSKRVRVKG